MSPMSHKLGDIVHTSDGDFKVVEVFAGADGECVSLVPVKRILDIESRNRFNKVLDIFEALWKSGWASGQAVDNRTWELAAKATGRKSSSASEETKEMVMGMLERVGKMKKEGVL